MLHLQVPGNPFVLILTSGLGRGVLAYAIAAPLYYRKPRPDLFCQQFLFAVSASG